VNLSQVCTLFGISRQAHYQKQWREAEREEAEVLILELVRQVRRKHPRMGTRKLFFKLQPMLSAEGLQIGRDRLFTLLRGSDLLVKPKKTYRHTTVPGYYRAPNRLSGLIIAHPNQVWVCDITYLELEGQKFAYLFVLMDLFSRFILGWQISPSLAADGAVASLEMALSQVPHLPQQLIHHSDHGVQYTAHHYMDTLLAHHILPSMGAIGNCYDNIYAERVMGILKNEYGLDRPFVDFDQVKPTIQEVIHLYNSDRPHLSLNYATPQAVFSGSVVDVPPLCISSAA
jgi:transposase InsO family protein